MCRLSTIYHKFNPVNMYAYRYMCLTKNERLETRQTHSLATEAPGRIWLQWSASILQKATVINPRGARHQDVETDCQFQDDLDLESVLKASNGLRDTHLAELIIHSVSVLTNLT